MIKDNHPGWEKDPTSSIVGGFDIPPEMYDADLPVVTRQISVKVDGDVEVVYRDGTSIVLTLIAGHRIPDRIVRVVAAGTTATGIQGFY